VEVLRYGESERAEVTQLLEGEGEAYQSAPSNVEVKDACSYTSRPPYVSTAPYINSSGTHPAYRPMGTDGSFSGGKAAGA
jgi:hypothetical protein